MAILAAIVESGDVQVLRRLEGLFNQLDLDAYLGLLDPAIEWQVAREDPDATVHRGHAAVRAYLEGWLDAFSDLRIHMEAVTETDEGVRTVIRFRGHGTGSGMPLDDRVNFVWSFHAGRVTKVADHGRDQASTK